MRYLRLSFAIVVVMTACSREHPKERAPVPVGSPGETTATMSDTTHAVEFDPAEASISANGNNPTWLLFIDGERAVLRIAGSTESYVGGEWTQQEPAYWDYNARRASAEGGSMLDFHLSSATCVDSTSGAQSSLVAILVRDGKTLFGCAVAGKLHLSPDTK